MPIYEYKCERCGIIVEKLLFSDPQAIFCEHCNSQMIKLISMPAVKSDCGDNSYPYYEENITDKPILLESSAHRKKVLKQYGLTPMDKKPGDSGQMI